MVAIGIVVVVGCDWVLVLWWLAVLRTVGLRKRDRERQREREEQ